MEEYKRELIYTKITRYKFSSNASNSGIGKLQKVVSNVNTKFEDIKSFLYNKFSNYANDWREVDSKTLSPIIENSLLDTKVPTIELHITFTLFDGNRSTIVVWDNVNGYIEKNFNDLKEKDEKLKMVNVKNAITLETL